MNYFESTTNNDISSSDLQLFDENGQIYLSFEDHYTNYNNWYTPLDRFFLYDNTYVFYPALFEIATTLTYAQLHPPHLHTTPSPDGRGLTLTHRAKVKPGVKEYTDEKVNFFKPDDDDTLEAYFSAFWNTCVGKTEKKNCDACLQPYYNKKELEKVEIELTCVICLTNKKSMVFVDCGHFSVCFKCSKQCAKCPICSKTSKNILKVYLS